MRHGCLYTFLGLVIGLIFSSLEAVIVCETYSAKQSILTLPEAVNRTLATAPQLKIMTCEIREAYGQKIQSKSFPNPIAAYSVENVFGYGDWKGWDSAESRYELEQLFELGGKRNYRHQFASYQYCVARAAYEARKNSLMNHVYKAYLEVAAAQEVYLLSLEQKQIAEEMYHAVSTQMEAGKVACLQQHKSEIALTSIQIFVEKAFLQFENAKAKLSLLWGSRCPDFDKVEYSLYETGPLSSLEEHLCRLHNNPELLKARLEIDAAQANLRLEKAEAIPDVVFGVGYKTLHDTREKGMMFGASVPIPLFDQNRGNIKSACSERQKAMILLSELTIYLEHKICALFREMERAFKEVELIKDTLLKTAQQSRDFVEEGYHKGKFEYLDLLECEKSFLEVKEKHIQALLDYHQSKADLEYLNSQEYP